MMDITIYKNQPTFLTGSIQHIEISVKDDEIIFPGSVQAQKERRSITSNINHETDKKSKPLVWTSCYLILQIWFVKYWKGPQDWIF